MRSYGSRYVNFLIPYIVTLGSYVVLHTVWNFNQGYGFVGAGLLALAYIIVGLILFFSFRKKNEYFARGVLWGIISIVIFLFTFGGCGVCK
jgi:hypothetical protein